MDTDALVPPDVLSSLSQILSNLVLGDNAIRTDAEKLLTEKWLASQPEAVILALAQLTRQAPDDHMRSFAAVLLRRLVFRSISPDSRHPHAAPLTIYDHLSEDTRIKCERSLLRSLREEPQDSVRKQVADSITDMASGSMNRGRPWPELQTVTFECSQSAVSGHRESAFRILASVPQLVLDQDVSVVLRVLEGGLQDSQSVDVRHAALRACSAYLTSADEHTQSQALGLMHPMLETLPPLSHSNLAVFLRTLTPLTTSQPSLFRPHLSSLLSFLVPLILAPSPSSVADLSDATPTVSNPHPLARNTHSFAFPPTPTASNPHPGSGSNHSESSGSRFLFPPPSHLASSSNGHGSNLGLHTSPSLEDEARDEMRRAALELLVSLSEARPAMTRSCHGWVLGVVRCCLEGMSEIEDAGGENTAAWSDANDPAEDDDDYGYPRVFEESLDRLACAVGGKALLPVAFQYIPALLASHDWMQRHAGLMAIAAIAEGTHQVMEAELGKVVALVTPMFHDHHPRVRYAACQCIGQLCTDLEEIIQDRHHREIFEALIPTLRAPEPRVHSHAAAAIINFCTGVDCDTLQPYLAAIVQGLLAMLNSDSKQYVQEQAITTLAMVADAAGETFQVHYNTIMPNLINVLRTVSDPELRSLRCKVMECAGIIAVAVGRDTFRPDAAKFADLLLQIQNNPQESGDGLTSNYLMSTWAKVCQATGPSFEPYLQYVMPPVLKSAGVKADVSYFDADRPLSTRDGWESFDIDGQRIEIRTSSLEEKCTAFDVLLVHCHVMGERFIPYLNPTLGVSLPALRFVFHDGVREAAAMVIPVLVACAQANGLVTQEFVTALFTPIIRALATELDSSFLASLFKCFGDCLRVLGRQTLQPELEHTFLEATKTHLSNLAQKRKSRMDRVHGSDWEEEREDSLLMEEVESFALDEIHHALEELDPSHALLIAVGSVKSMSIAVDDDSEGDGGDEGQ